MSDLNRYASWGISIDGDTVSNLTEDHAMTASLQKALLTASGDIHASVGATITNTPKISCKTHNLALLEAPQALVSGVVIGARKYDDAAGMGTGYKSWTIAKGLLVPTSISAQAGQPAVLAFDLYPISSNGTTAPIVEGTTALTLEDHGDVYTLGDFGIAAAAVDGVQSLNLDFGFNIKTTAGENGYPFPTLAYYDSQQAIISATVAGITAVTAAHLNTGSVAAVYASFRKLVEGGVPSGGLKVSFPKSVLECDTLQGGRPVTAQLKASAVKSGANDYLTFASL